MIFLFSTSEKVGSQLIRWGRDSDCSHFSVCWDGLIKDLHPDYWLVTESRALSGVKADWLSVVKRSNKINHAMKINIGANLEQAYYSKYITEMGGKQYDTEAVSYFSFVTLWEKMGFTASRKNEWDDPMKVFCTETVKVFEPLFKAWDVQLPSTTALLDPHELYDSLVNNKHFTEISKELLL